MTSRYSCWNNRPPTQPHVALFQDGWTADGRRNMVEYPVAFSPAVRCGHFGLAGSNRQTDPECEGCECRDIPLPETKEDK